jgi:hypothetical protein
MSSVAIELTECLNCRTPLHGPYCATCGQKATTPNPTFHDLLHEFTHEMLHVDGRLFQSIALLFRHPGRLTKDHTQGRRARHLAPLRLYLIFSVLFFAAAAYAPSDTTITEDVKRGRVLETGGVRISGDIFFGKLSDEEVEERIRRAEHDWLPRLMFVLVPVWALLVMAATRREKHHLPDHLYFSLHAHAAFFAVFAVGQLLRILQVPYAAKGWTFVNIPFVIGYTAVAMHTVYGGTWWRAARRTFFVLSVYAVILIVALIVFFSTALLV